MVDYVHVPWPKCFAARMLTLDLLAVANLLVLSETLL